MRAGTAAGLAQINLDDDGGSAQQDAEHCADGLRPAFVPSTLMEKDPPSAKYKDPPAGCWCPC